MKALLYINKCFFVYLYRILDMSSHGYSSLFRIDKGDLRLRPDEDLKQQQCFIGHRSEAHVDW